MMKHLVLMISILMAIGSSANAHSQNGGFNIKDAKNVQEAVEAIKFTLEGQGFEIVTMVNFKVAAESIGVEIRPTTVIIATNPSLETPLIRRKQTVALDFPSKFLVFEDAEGEIQLEHSTIGAWIDRHDLELKGANLRKYDHLLDQFGNPDNGIVVVQSHQSVDDTEEALFSRLQELGLMIFVPKGIDFQEQAFQHGGYIRPTRLVIFGTPAVGIPLVENKQSIGLDLPDKFLIFEDDNDQVFIAFNHPRFLALKHNLQRDADPTMSLDVRLEMILGNFMNLANFIANPT
jgi:uncharacterized protein (DUF302 family)